MRQRQRMIARRRRRKKKSLKKRGLWKRGPAKTRGIRS